MRLQKVRNLPIFPNPLTVEPNGRTTWFKKRPLSALWICNAPKNLNRTERSFSRVFWYNKLICSDIELDSLNILANSVVFFSVAFSLTFNGTLSLICLSFLLFGVFRNHMKLLFTGTTPVASSGKALEWNASFTESSLSYSSKMKLVSLGTV